MRRPTTILTAAILALTALVFAGSANAQTDSNPPGVARISLIHGDVSMQRGDSGDSSAVDLNTPLVGGDKVFTGSRSRAEVQLDWANVLRLDENAQADIASLDRTRIQVQLAQGLAFFSVLKGSEADIEIDTPNVAVIPRREGRYRIEVTAAGDTFITVREGEADISTPDGSTILKKNEFITVRGSANDAQFQTSRAPSTDDFDRWNQDRDRIIASAESYRRTNRYYTGASDLDAYGRWDRVPDYGYVWVPRVTAGWAPYRQGRWVWQPYWGWTWTSYEPWGWAPYHYGRWFVHGGSWAWWPGPVTPFYRPVYAPAYVSFFGFGSHSGVNVGISFGSGFGSIGWLPTGPCDYVSPWWGRNRNNFNVVNITNITNVYNVRNVNVIAPLRGGNRDSNVHNMLVNNQVRYSLSTVSADNFGRGRANVRSATTAELRDGHLMTGNVPVVPSRESLRSSDRTVNTAAARGQNDNRFFSRRAPSTQRESFSDESARLQQAMGRDLRLGASNDGGGNRNTDNRAADNRGPDNRTLDNSGAGTRNDNRGADNRGTDNRPAANNGGFGNRNGNTADVNSQRQAPSTLQVQTPHATRPQTPQADSPREPNGNGGWRRFGGGQPASGASQNVQPQREPVMRAPLQRSSSPEASPNRLERQADQPRSAQPTQNDNRASDTQPGFSRFPGRNADGRDAERVITTPDSSNQRSGNQRLGNQIEQNSDNGRQNGWQRFSGGPRSYSSAGESSINAQASSPSSSQNDTRRPIQLNRPIIQPRDSGQSGNSGNSGNRGPSESPRSAPRESAPSSNQRVAPPPTPRSAPQPSAPSASGNRPAPETSSRPDNSSRSGGGGFGGGNRSAPSSSNSRGRAEGHK